MPVRRTKVRLSVIASSMRLMDGASHAPCQVALDMLIFCIQAKTLRRRKAVKLFFVISKRFRVQRLAAQVPLDMDIYG